jgi:hypothetical protein
MSQKPSLKKAKLAVQKSVLVLSKEEYSQLHESVIIPFEQAIDNVRNNDELFYDISENLIGIFGYKPSYAMFQLCREETKKALMESKKITETTFKNHYWKYVRDFLDINKEFTFPKSNTESAIKKQNQREKVKSMTGLDGIDYLVSEIDDAKLEKLFGLRGKAELVKRELENEKESEKLQTKARKANSDNFLARMKTLVKEKYDLAMYIEGKLADYENDFNAEKN